MSEASLFSTLLGQRIRMSYLAQLLRRVGHGLQAGIDARKVWEQEAKRGPVGYRTVFAEISRRQSQGDCLEDAVRDSGVFFPPLVAEMVNVGEATGKLESVLIRLSDHYSHLLELRRKFLIGITWPAIQLGAAICIVGMLIWLLGVIAPMTGGEPIDILGFGLVGNKGLLIYALFISGCAAAIMLFVTAIVRQWFGSLPIRIALKIPLLGGCLQTMAIARMTWTLAMALESGIDARKSIRLALRSSQMPHWMELENGLGQTMYTGVEFHEALRETNTFPEEFLNALEAAEISGRLAESMLQLSNDYQTRAETATQTLTVVATFLIWGAVAALLVFLIFRLAMFYIGQLYSALDMVQ